MYVLLLFLLRPSAADTSLQGSSQVTIPEDESVKTFDGNEGLKIYASD